MRPPARRPSRFGFVFEGIFRQHYIVKGRNRDTAWHTIINTEWRPVRDEHSRNGSIRPISISEGRQITPLNVPR